MKQCECRTVRGARCKVTKNLIYLNHGGHEYLACTVHSNSDFVPYRVVDNQWPLPLPDGAQWRIF